MKDKYQYVIDHLNLYAGPIYPWEAYFEDWKDQINKSKQWVANAPFDLLETVLDVIVTKPTALHYPGLRDNDDDDEWDEMDQQLLDSWECRIDRILHAWCQKDKERFLNTVQFIFARHAIDWSLIQAMVSIFSFYDLAKGIRWINSLVAEAVEIPSDIAEGIARTLDTIISKRLRNSIHDDMLQSCQQLMDTITVRLSIDL